MKAKILKMWNRSAADHGFSGFALPKKGSQEGHGKDGGPPVKAGAYPWRRRKIRPGQRDDAVFKLRKPMAEMGRYKKRRGGNVSPLPVLFLFSAADDEDIAFGVADDGLGDAADDKAFDGI